MGYQRKKMVDFGFVVNLQCTIIAWYSLAAKTLIFRLARSVEIVFIYSIYLFIFLFIYFFIYLLNCYRLSRLTLLVFSHGNNSPLAAAYRGSCSGA